MTYPILQDECITTTLTIFVTVVVMMVGSMLRKTSGASLDRINLFFKQLNANWNEEDIKDYSPDRSYFKIIGIGVAAIGSALVSSVIAFSTLEQGFISIIVGTIMLLVGIVFWLIGRNL
jgi:hypothetical protein